MNRYRELRRHHHPEAPSGDEERREHRGRRGGRGEGPGVGRGERRGGRGGGRAPRGDVRAAVLLLLTEEPMHGYQLMQAIADRSDGRWAPSPGAIYPALRQLEAEGLVEVTAESGRRLATITDAGREVVEARQDEGGDPFAGAAGSTAGPDLRDLLGQLHSAVRQVGRHGTDAQRAAAAETLTQARRSIYLLLADVDADAPPVTLLTAAATVVTDAAARYAKQLAAHLGRRCEVREEEGGTRLVLDAGECLLTATDATLELRASAGSEEELEVVLQVVGSHLERFGQRNELQVAWTRP